MSRKHDQLVEQVEEAIINRIAKCHEALEPQLAKLDEMEAISVLGMLMDDTLARFPPHERAGMLAAIVAELQEGGR